MNTGSKYKHVVKRLLLKDLSKSQLLLYAIGVFIGLTIILLSFQFYRDINEGIGKKGDIFETRDFIVLSRHIDGLSFSSKQTDLTDILAKLQEQPWVVQAQPFTSANFNITAQVDFGGRPLSTALFMESVPDTFFDELPAVWKFDSESSEPTLPIILPRDYLALYNFGFAASRGLPKMGEAMLKSIPIKLSLSGNGRQQFINARIAGFTSRLNTIAVPPEFIEWGNNQFGDGTIKNPVRVVAEVNIPPSDSRISQFVKDNNLEIGGDKGLAESSSHVIAIIAWVIIVIGAIIALLSIALLIISIFLLLHKTRPVIYRLLTLGYSPKKLSGVYSSIFATVNVIVLIISLTATYIGQIYFHKAMSENGLKVDAGFAPTVGLAVLAVIIITAMCYWLFHCKIINITRK